MSNVYIIHICGHNICMEYVKGKPYFIRDGSSMAYPYLCRDISCDTLIIGGGINGAIANHYLSQTHDVVLVERSRIGYGCTSCATALLEYQLDDFASALSSTMSDDDIVACYRLGLHAIDEIERFIHTHGNHCHFYRRPTLIYSQDDKYASDIRDECAFRIQHGFQCEYIDRAHNPFYFDIACGLYCERGGAEVDPYFFTQQLIQCSANQSHIYENTEISNISRSDNGYTCTTRYGNIITCRNVVLATGFDFEHIDTDLCTRYISYSIVTQPLPELMWYRRALLQDCLDPYHYMRTLPDGRIIFGGEDTPMSDTIDAKKADKQYAKLLSQLQALFPDTDIVAEYKFCGAFGTTDNNMGIIGRYDDGVYYFISCGANGIINAMRGVHTLQHLLDGQSDEYADIFAPHRE